MIKINISPSLMCADLTNLEESIKKIEELGIDALHIDLIDGAFSPSIPLGLDIIKKIRNITSLPFDAHVMSVNNAFFIEELLNLKVESISFHSESTLHIDRLINMIKNAGSKVGLALNPATSLSVLDYVLPSCDKILLMLINPGFAGDENEKMVPYAMQKIRDLKQLIADKNLNTKIQVDGRVSLDVIAELIKAGADDLVVGSTGLFITGRSLKQNKRDLDDAIMHGLDIRK